MAERYPQLVGSHTVPRNIGDAIGHELFPETENFNPVAILQPQYIVGKWQSVVCTIDEKRQLAPRKWSRRAKVHAVPLRGLGGRGVGVPTVGDLGIYLKVSGVSAMTTYLTNPPGGR